MPKKRQHTKDSTPPDFEKKKRKVGKSKKPAENETTQLNFRSGSIVVPSQLAGPSADQPTTHRGLGLDALLTQLKHPNQTTRVNALHGLKDLLQSNLELLPLNLAKLVEQVLVAVNDESSQVRHALSSLVGFLVNKSPLEKILPFSSLIVAHLNCGLTHINERIQIDALKILDQVLNKPSILVPHVHTVLPLLVKLISRKKTSSSEAPKSSFLSVMKGKIAAKQKGSALVSNPESKLADHSAKLQILVQVSKLLEAVLSSQNLDVTNSRNESLRIGPTIDTVNKIVFVPNQTTGTNFNLVDFSSPIPHVPIFRHSGVYLSFELPSQKPSENFDNVLVPYSKLQLILSILSESWIDCSANFFLSSFKESTKEISLLEVILQLLLSTLRIALLAGSTIKSSNSSSELRAFLTKFWADFQAHFLSRFPLLSQPNFSSFKSNLDFNICLITVKLLENIPNAQNGKEALTAITTYLASLSSVKITSSQNTQSFQNIVETLIKVYVILVSQSMASYTSHDLLSTVTDGVWRVFTSCHLKSKDRQLFHECFGELLKSTLGEHAKDMVMSKLLLPWLRSVPEHLGVVTLVLDPLIEGVGGVRGVEEVEAIVTALFKNVSTIRRLPVSTLRKVAGLVWRIPAQSFFRSVCVEAITQAIQSGVIECSMAVYLVQTIHHKFSYQCSPAEQDSVVGHYLSSMLSAVIGCSSSNLATFSKEKSNSLTPPLFSIVGTGASLDHLYRNKISKVVCECLSVCSVSAQVLHILEPTLLSLADITMCLPLDTVIGLLALGKSLLPKTVPLISKNLSLFFAHLCLTLFITMETTYDFSTDHPTAPKLTNEILESSELVTDTLLAELPCQLSREQTSGNAVNVMAILKSVVSLVNSGLVAQSKEAVVALQSVVTLAMTEGMDCEIGRLVTQLQMMHSNLAIQTSVRHT